MQALMRYEMPSFSCNQVDWKNFENEWQTFFLWQSTVSCAIFSRIHIHFFPSLDPFRIGCMSCHSDKVVVK